MTAEEFVHRLSMVKQNGIGRIAKCPAHDDNAPSLSITEGDDGRTILKCHAGCATTDIVKAMGSEMGDLFVEPSSTTPSSPGRAASVGAPIDPAEIISMHEALTTKQRHLLRQERCLSDEVIDRYQIGFTMKHGDGRVAIPIPNTASEIEDVRCWLPPVSRTTKSPKILHWGKGYGSARIYPVDMLKHKELVLVPGELDALPNYQ
jgi:hypothetical protein